MRQVGDEELLEELEPELVSSPSIPWVSKSTMGSSSGTRTVREFRARLEFEPEEGVGGERQGVRLRGDGGEGDIAEHLDGDHAGKAGEVERDGLGEAG